MTAEDETDGPTSPQHEESTRPEVPPTAPTQDPAPPSEQGAAAVPAQLSGNEAPRGESLASLAKLPGPPESTRSTSALAPRPARKRVAARPTARKAASPPAKKATASLAPPVVPPLRPTTLAIDIGGTGLKASVLDAAGKLVADRVRVVTPYPCTTKALVEALAGLVAPLPSFDRVSVGFPGVVRKGLVLTAPHFVTKTGAPGEPPVPKLLAAWTGFDLASALSSSFGHPVRVCNDADLQGLDVVSGSGLEFVVTLGTGVGTALFLDGKLTPHLELAHHPFRRGQTYDEQLGDTPLRRIGAKKWRKRFDEALVNFQSLLNYDKLYVGGGNARLLVGHVGPSVTIVDNLAGILGGIKLWEIEE
ncbi:MAG: ROK family protein [Acidimicrobiales bacterium]